MSASSTRHKTGVVKGTGSALTVEKDKVGFKPTVVTLTNLTGLATAYWTETMADDSMVKRVTAGTMTAPTSGGVTPTASGFTLGADTDMNVTDELIHYECWG